MKIIWCILFPGLAAALIIDSLPAKLEHKIRWVWMWGANPREAFAQSIMFGIVITLIGWVIYGLLAWFLIKNFF